jgi:hypothetical protein
MSINITEVVSLTGAPGLHTIVKRDDRAIIIESIDDKKKRQMVKGSMMLSKLSDITMYTDDDEGEFLHVIFKNIHEKYGKDLPVTKKSSNAELMDFLGEVLPNFDRERVYPSNVKKLVSWYGIVAANDVDLTVEEEAEEIEK